MGTLSSAYNYAKDLNAAMTDIRIVTGKSIEDMERFAEQANAAAKALSSTTTEYAKASLIYFQQGDDEATAMTKAAITTKMANVTGQDASIVSDQLTSIWNNFNKAGEKSYEHFVDILTKLGAETASSTDEIANGL
jgi:TP901 family phage tail tape measure protein